MRRGARLTAATLQTAALLTDEWLGNIGFKWHQGERQPTKHWRLFLGFAIDEPWRGAGELAIEVAAHGFGANRHGVDIGATGAFFCWVLSVDSLQKFVSIRDLRTQQELIALVEALTGCPWIPANIMYGNLYHPEQAKKLITQSEAMG